MMIRNMDLIHPAPPVIPRRGWYITRPPPPPVIHNFLVNFTLFFHSKITFLVNLYAPKKYTRMYHKNIRGARVILFVLPEVGGWAYSPVPEDWTKDAGDKKYNIGCISKEAN